MSIPYKELIADYVDKAIKQAKIEALQDIKLEVESHAISYPLKEEDKYEHAFNDGLYTAYDVIANRISELKGE